MAVDSSDSEEEKPNKKSKKVIGPKGSKEPQPSLPDVSDNTIQTDQDDGWPPKEGTFVAYEDFAGGKSCPRPWQLGKVRKVKDPDDRALIVDCYGCSGSDWVNGVYQKAHWEPKTPKRTAGWVYDNTKAAAPATVKWSQVFAWDVVLDAAGNILESDRECVRNHVEKCSECLSWSSGSSKK
jgi:hypothetical protein